MEYSLIDTHCHITCDALYERIEEIMENAKHSNVKTMMIICTNFIEYERAVYVKEKCQEFLIKIALGFHPCDLNDVTEQDFQRLETLIQENKIDAVGEIGMDYYWDTVEKNIQKKGFHRQLQLAKKYHKPIIIHMREATKDTLDILSEYAPLKGIMHCFSGSIETAKQVMQLGLFISFAGPITFKNARGAVEVCADIPIDKLLTETDSPYLTPHPYRGTQNEPKYVTVTFEKICEIKQIAKELLAKQMQENFERLFI